MGLKNFKAIILAAGEGKRLRPLTQNCPKAMVKLFGKSILERQIETFYACNISDISVVKGYLAAKINFPNVTYFVNSKYSSTNMVETLFCAREKLTDKVIISYGDIIFEKKILENLIDSQNDCSVIIDLDWEKLWKIRFSDPLDDAESLQFDENYIITEIGQKTKLKKIMGQYIGLIKFQGEGLTFLKKFYDKCKDEARKSSNPLNNKLPFEESFMTDLLQNMIEAEFSIKAVPINHGWLELDSKNDYDTYNRLYQENTLSEILSLKDC